MFDHKLSLSISSRSKALTRNPFNKGTMTLDRAFVDRMTAPKLPGRVSIITRNPKTKEETIEDYNWNERCASYVCFKKDAPTKFLKLSRIFPRVALR